VCLIRAATDADADRRLSETLADLSAHHSLSADERSRIVALRGDITQPRLGLSAAAWESLALSTVMVAGRRTGLIPERELDDSAGFWSTYEQSKCDAERAVWAEKPRLPVSVFRLSMVVGDSRTGHTSAFNVMYWPLKMLSRGVFWIAPGDPEGVVDIVPVDYVADAIEAIGSNPSHCGQCFHIAAGPEACCTMSELLDLAVEVMGVRRPVLVRPALFFACVRPLLLAVTWGKRRQALRKARIYLPYLSYAAKFDTTRTRAMLEPFGLRPPPVRAYFRTLIEYAIAADWGKRATAPAVREP
jgi:thioester reductase-like protein